MSVLGLETATTVCSVGIAREDGSGSERQLREPRIHSEKILTLIDELLRSEGIDWNAVEAIAVSRGPGSFTGLRIGFSTAKGLCYASGKPLVAVPTFDAMALAASAHFPTVENILVALDAKKGDFYCGSYRFNKGRLVDRSATEVVKETFANHPIKADLVLTDSETILKTLVDAETEVCSALEYCRGDVVAKLGLERLRRGDVADTALCEPLYLKDFVVKSTSQQGK